MVAMRPNGTVANAWTVTNAATAHEALDDVVDQPSAGSTADGYVETSGNNQTVNLDLTAPTDVDVGTAATAYFEAARIVGTANNQRMILEIRDSADNVLATFTTANLTSSTYGWFSVSISSQSWTQTDVNGLRIAATASKNGGGASDTIGIRAAYLDLTYTPVSGDTTVTPSVIAALTTAPAATPATGATVEPATTAAVTAAPAATGSGTANPIPATIAAVVAAPAATATGGTDVPVLTSTMRMGAP